MNESGVDHGWERHFRVRERIKGGRCVESRGSRVVADVIWNTRGCKGAVLSVRHKREGRWPS